MRLCLATILSALSASCGVLINRLEENDLIGKFQIQMEHIVLDCELSDMISINFPILEISDVIYRLYKPDGEKFPMSESKFSSITNFDEKITDNTPKVNKKTEIKVFNINRRIEHDNALEENSIYNQSEYYSLENLEEPNRKVTIGPLNVDDYGNWVLSLFFKDINDDWAEMFQVISVNIMEDNIPMITNLENTTVKLSFAYPMQDITSCQLVTPAVAAEKKYDRDPNKMKWCGYIIPDYNSIYNGKYQIIGVGKITYRGRITLKHIK